MNPYLGVLLFLFFAAAFAVSMLALSYLLGPKNKTRTKQLPFECGAVSVGSASRLRVNVRFYLVAVLFVLFDVEVVFMYPWAVALADIGWSGFIQMLVFAGMLSVGFMYVWRKGIFNWNN